jgi:hypothetical protein
MKILNRILEQKLSVHWLKLSQIKKSVKHSLDSHYGVLLSDGEIIDFESKLVKMKAEIEAVQGFITEQKNSLS